jgi:hypothetical protein
MLGGVVDVDDPLIPHKKCRPVHQRQQGLARNERIHVLPPLGISCAFFHKPSHNLMDRICAYFYSIEFVVK